MNSNLSRRTATKSRSHEEEKFFPRLRVFVSSWLAIAAVASLATDVGAQSKTRTYVETLASPRLEGRLAGSNGERLASDFLVAELQKIGAKPLPGQTDFRLPFEFTAGSRDGGSTIDLGRQSVATTPEVRAL